MKKNICIIIIILTTAVFAMAQNSFVVVDKSGQSQLVKSLDFHQEQYGDRTSTGIHYIWNAEGSASGAVEDLDFIARANITLANGTTSDVTSLLEEISGNNNADAAALSSMLEDNQDVEEVHPSEDGQTLIVKFKDTDCYSVYPVNLLKDPFEEDIYNTSHTNSYAVSSKNSIEFIKTGSNGKVAVFNYFSNHMTRKTQNEMLKFMMNDLNNHGYGVEYYPYEKMNVANLKNVIDNSTDYMAIIIISHGFSSENRDNKLSYFAIGEAYDKYNYDADVKLFIDSYASENDKLSFSSRFWNEGFGAFDTEARYDCAVNVKKLDEIDNNVILYMGSCDAYRYYTNTGTCIGWAGANTTAQAHAALLFYNLMRGKTLADAIDVKDEEDQYYYSITQGQQDSWPVDPETRAQMKYQLQGIFRFSTYMDPPLFTPVNQYYRHGRCFLVTVPSGYNGPFFISDKKVTVRFYMRNDFGANASVSYPTKIYIKATPFRSDESTKIYSLDLINESGTYEGIDVKLPSNGLYVLTAATDEEFSNEILLRKPLIFVKATPFKENSGGGEMFFATCPDDNHPHAIDLGLPSGTLWSCCNVGAEKPEDCGYYYAWGDVNEADEYEFGGNVFDNYIHCDGTANSCYNLGASICGTEYDVAHVKWGGNWRMPTYEEIKEIREKCTMIYSQEDKGFRMVGPNNNSVFLPCAGQQYMGVGTYGRYWTGIQYEGYIGSAYRFEFFNPYGYSTNDTGLRGSAYSVRPVINTNAE